jgi:hypothetical protein
MNKKGLFGGHVYVLLSEAQELGREGWAHQNLMTPLLSLVQVIADSRVSSPWDLVAFLLFTSLPLPSTMHLYIMGLLSPHSCATSQLHAIEQAASPSRQPCGLSHRPFSQHSLGGSRPAISLLAQHDAPPFDGSDASCAPRALDAEFQSRHSACPHYVRLHTD